MSHGGMHGLGVLGLVVLAACQSSRPTEFVNITFTPSVHTDDYATWDFDLDHCLDSDDPRVDAALLRKLILSAIQEILEERGYERRMEQAVDFTVFYELSVTDGGDLVGVEERTRGKILLRDSATGRLVWRGERKAPMGGGVTPEELRPRVRRFVRELLQYTHVLEKPEQQG